MRGECKINDILPCLGDGPSFSSFSFVNISLSNRVGNRRGEMVEGGGSYFVLFSIRGGAFSIPHGRRNVSNRWLAFRSVSRCKLFCNYYVERVINELIGCRAFQNDRRSVFLSTACRLALLACNKGACAICLLVVCVHPLLSSLISFRV